MNTSKRRTLRWQDRVLLALAATLLLLFALRTATLQAQTLNEPLDEAHWGLEFADGERVVAMDTEIRATVNGLTAHVAVTQHFENQGDEWMEAVYRYPLPAGAAVDSMLIEADDRIIEGEIREKEQAQREYQAARKEGKIASLVEQQHSNQFKTRIANIAPGTLISVSIGFLVQVDFKDGQYRMRLPMTFSPGPVRTGHESVPMVSTVDDHYLTLDIELNTGMELGSIESPFHDIDVHPGLDGYHVFLANPDTRSDRVFELNWTAAFTDQPQASLSTWSDGDDVFAQLMLAPPLQESLAPRPREVVFIIDTSGSMAGGSLDQAKAALLNGLESLGPDDRFNLVRFSSKTRVLFEESVPVYDNHLRRASDYIHSLEPDGGTVMAPALRAALTLPALDNLLRQVVFITDGAAGNESELLAQIANQLGDSRLFTVSIGSAPNAWFMRKAAEIGRGSHTRIGKLDQVEQGMSSLWQRIRNPAVQNLCVDWGMPAEFYPEIIPDLYAGDPLWLYVRLPEAPGSVLICGELDGEYWEHVVDGGAQGGSEQLARQWAQQKIIAYQDSLMFGADADQVRSDITDTALEYGLLSPYTSLVAIDKTPSRPADGDPGNKLGSNTIPSLLPAGSTLTAGFAATASGWVWRALLGMFCFLIACGMLLVQPAGDRRPMAPASP